MSDSSSNSDTGGHPTSLDDIVDSYVKPVVVSVFLSCILLGVLLVTIAVYFTRFQNDRLHFRIFVALCTVAAIIDTAFNCRWAWRFTVDSLLDASMLRSWPWEYNGYAILTGIVVAACQLFFAWRLWVVSNRQARLLTGLIVVLILGSWICDIYYGSQLRVLTDLPKYREIAWAWVGSSVVVDILITTSILYYLLFRPRTMRVVSSATAATSPLTRLAILAMRANAASLIVQVGMLIAMTVRQSTLQFVIPAQLEAKTYILCVVATLNARQQVDGHTVSYPSATTASRSRGLGARLSHAVQVEVKHEVGIEMPVAAYLARAREDAVDVRFEVGDDGMSEAEKGRGHAY
ncbi:hypothetical protein JCM8547_006634 [Rhodosporidiobolus lusitaniae]